MFILVDFPSFRNSFRRVILFAIRDASRGSLHNTTEHPDLPQLKQPTEFAEGVVLPLLGIWVAAKRLLR